MSIAHSSRAVPVYLENQGDFLNGGDDKAVQYTTALQLTVTYPIR